MLFKCDSCNKLLIDDKGRHYEAEIYFEYEPDLVLCGKCSNASTPSKE